VAVPRNPILILGGNRIAGGFRIGPLLGERH
jgi:hypothetical protein